MSQKFTPTEKYGELVRLVTAHFEYKAEDLRAFNEALQQSKILGEDYFTIPREKEMEKEPNEVQVVRLPREVDDNIHKVLEAMMTRERMVTSISWQLPKKRYEVVGPERLNDFKTTFRKLWQSKPSAPGLVDVDADVVLGFLDYRQGREY